MSKTLVDAPLTSRSSRKRLEPGVYWRVVDADIHLGYRRGKRVGAWLVRWRNDKGYKQAALGTPDDEVSVGTLDYHAAIRAARLHVEAVRTETKAFAEGPIQTVASAVVDYIAERDARDSRRVGRATRSDAARRLEKYVIGRPCVGNCAAIQAAPLAAIPLHKLKDSDLILWRENLNSSLKATAVQRLLNDLKAALNRAAQRHKAKLPLAFSGIVKSALKARVSDEDEDVPLARESQILNDDQIRKILAACSKVDSENNWDGDLFRLILVMAATGARFSQVARLRVGHVQYEMGRVMMPKSRKGRGGKGGEIPVPAGEDVLAALRIVTTGRDKNDWLLERWRHEQQSGEIRWRRVSRGPWQLPGEIVRPWSLIRQQVNIPEAIPYALRHSSIVRGIRANLPLRLVAAIHDTSVVMIERHYARYIADGLDEMAMRAVVPLIS